MIRSSWSLKSILTIGGVAFTACGEGTTDPPPVPPLPPEPVTPAISLDMTLGEVVTLTDPSQVRVFQLNGGGESRDYEVIVQSASSSFGGWTDMQVKIKAQGASANAVPVELPQLFPTLSGFERERVLRASSFSRERALRASTRRELLRVGARPLRVKRNASASIVSSGSPPQLGQMMDFTIGVDENLNGDCSNPTIISGEVMYVGQNFTIVEDVQFAAELSSSQRLSSADYQKIGDQLDTVVFPTDVAYFGAPADIDSNGTVIALITAEVNRMSEAGSGSIIAGFFWSGDLMGKASCPASNEGEIFYLAGPDPNSTFGAEIDLDFANTLARTTVAHEFFHLLNTQQRITKGGGNLSTDLEHSWLDEGLAHLAEEVAGLASVGLGTRSNFDLSAVLNSDEELDAFNDFHLLNFDRFGRFLQGGCPEKSVGPANTQALGATGGSDPGGVESLKFRGFAYGFVRWLGDQFGPEGSGQVPGSREEDLFRELSSGGPSHLSGVANVLRGIQVVSGSNVEWRELVASYMASLVVDDAAPAGVDPRTQFKTWDLRGLFQQANDNPADLGCPFDRTYPLFPAVVTLTPSLNQTISFTVNSATGRFISMSSSGVAPDVVLEVMNPSGGALLSDARAQVTIIRTG